MKRLAYITALILSLLIIYTGAGVSIVHYCCARCEVVKSCCDTGCPKCKKTHACGSKKDFGKDSRKDCKSEGCSATIYKPDLMQHHSALGQAFTVPVMNLFCEQFCYLLTVAHSEQLINYDPTDSPPPVCSRQMLALYSTYLI